MVRDGDRRWETVGDSGRQCISKSFQQEPDLRVCPSERT